jgi:hypothetical protein
MSSGEEWDADHHPAPGPTHVYRLLVTLFEERDGTVHPSIVVPPGQYPLPGAHFDVIFRRRSFIDNGVGGGVFSYPRIRRYYFGLSWYVRSASASAPIAYLGLQITPAQVLSTSRKRQNSRMWCSSPDRGASNGSPPHSKRRSNICIFDKSRLRFLTTLSSSVSVQHQTCRWRSKLGTVVRP